MFIDTFVFYPAFNRQIIDSNTVYDRLRSLDAKIIQNRIFKSFFDFCQTDGSINLFRLRLKFPRVRKRIIRILPYRDSSIAINFLNMSEVTVKKVSPINRDTTAALRTRSL